MIGIELIAWPQFFWITSQGWLCQLAHVCGQLDAIKDSCVASNHPDDVGYLYPIQGFVANSFEG